MLPFLIWVEPTELSRDAEANATPLPSTSVRQRVEATLAYVSRLRIEGMRKTFRAGDGTKRTRPTFH